MFSIKDIYIKHCIQWDKNTCTYAKLSKYIDYFNTRSDINDKNT